MFSALAEFERDVIRERTQAGLRAARARGRMGGRPKEMLSELERVLHYPRIRNKFTLSDQAIEEYVASLRHDCVIIETTRPVTGISEDPDDDKFLACAMEAHADIIVSGDPHLVNLGSFQGIPILTPRQFLDRLS